MCGEGASPELPCIILCGSSSSSDVLMTRTFALCTFLNEAIVVPGWWIRRACRAAHGVMGRMLYSCSSSASSSDEELNSEKAVFSKIGYET